MSLPGSWSASRADPVRLDAFRDLVRRQAALVPAEFLDGVLEVTVSPRALPHPTRPDIYTLGECIPIPTEAAGPEGIQSRIVLYHGSFAALAQLGPDFDWRGEAWETLTHELRHHVEWRAQAPDLEALDRAVEENFARVDGDRFDPLFYRDGEQVVPGVYRVEDDYFLECPVPPRGGDLDFSWHGRAWRAPLPPDLTLPAFLTVEGVADPPPGDLVLVLRAPTRLRQLFRARDHAAYQSLVHPRPAPTGQ